MKRKSLPAVLLLAVLLLAAPVLYSQDSYSPSSEDVCDNVCFSRIDDGLFTCRQECRTSNSVKLPPGFDFLVKKVRERIQPPLLKSKTFTPAEPARGEQLKVRLTPAVNDVSVLADQTIKFLYTSDPPSKWLPLVPDFDPVAAVWDVSFTTPADSDILNTTVRIGDFDGNTYIEASCPLRDPNNTSDPCYFPLSDDESYEKMPEFHIDPALDLLSAKFGMDDRRFYFKVKTRGGIKKGKLIPKSAYYYMISLYDPDRPTGVDPYHRTSFVYYSPNFDPNSPCKALVRRGSKWVYDASPVRCRIENDTLTITVMRKTIGAPVSGLLTMYVATGVIYDEDNGIIVDYSPSTAVRIDGKPLKLK